MRNFELEVHFSKWEFKAKHHMTASDAQSMTLTELLDMASQQRRDEFNNLWLGYTQTWGAAALRSEIANTYDNINAKNVLCFAGAEEGIYAAMRVMLEPGDHVIVLVPNYQAAETLPLDICEVTGVALDPNNDWRVDMDALRDAIQPNTKLISINFPNNPTGAVMPREDFDELVALCRQHGIYLFSDEVYRGLEMDPAKRIPQAADVYERGLSLNVMSKAYGLPGLRIGWIACQDVGLLHKLEQYKHYLSICNSGPSEQLSLIALEVRTQILARNYALLSSNLDLVDQFFSEYPDMFEWQRPDGGCVAYPRFKPAVGVEQFCKDIVDEEGVLLLPASVYKSDLMTGLDDRFRIGFGRDNLKEGLDAMRSFMDRHHNSYV